MLHYGQEDEVIGMTISEVSKIYGVSPDALRYYERVGAIPPVRRNAAGIRDYDETDCGWVELVKCMRSAGLPVEALVEYVRLYGEGNATLAQRRDLLLRQRAMLEAQIETMRSTLARLDFKISRYEVALNGGELNFGEGGTRE